MLLHDFYDFYGGLEEILQEMIPGAHLWRLVFDVLKTEASTKLAGRIREFFLCVYSVYVRGGINCSTQKRDAQNAIHK